MIAALSLGEVAAVAMSVETPGWHTFAHDLWREMHTGVQNYVAALCLLLLGAAAAAAALGFTVVLLVRRAGKWARR